MSKFIETEDAIIRTSDIAYVTKAQEEEKSSLGSIVKIWQTIRIYLRHSNINISFRCSSENDRDRNYDAIVKKLKEEEESNEKSSETN